MKNLTLALGIPLLAAVTSAGCIKTYEDDCEVSGTCPPSGDGDGDTGGTGGDGDGDETGGNGGGGASSGGGDGDTGGTGGTTDPCDACTGDTPFCDDQDTCVECLEASDCSDPSLPMCLSGACEAGCTDNADCTHFADAGVCDTGSGACVECLPTGDDRASDVDACGTNVCNPTTLECESGLSQATKDICAPCIADSECLAGQNCIPLEYTGGAEPVALGGFCMKLAPGCSPPFQAGAINRTSLSGAEAADYCGLAEEFTTCAAIKDLTDGKLCASPSDCGSGNGDGLCETVNLGTDPQCTYSCTGSAQCEVGFDCGGVVGSKYCGG